MAGAGPDGTLVLGGARSGKSTFAERLVEASGLSPVYMATGRALDDEMRMRIAHHRQRRGSGWTTVEEPLQLTEVLAREARSDRAILVDCLTLWVTSLMMAGQDVRERGDELGTGIANLPGMLVFVSNEVGMGIVPENRMVREFRDHTGFLHQKVAGQCDQVYLMAAGLPLKLKG